MSCYKGIKKITHETTMTENSRRDFSEYDVKVYEEKTRDCNYS